MLCFYLMFCGSYSLRSLRNLFVHMHWEAQWNKENWKSCGVEEWSKNCFPTRLKGMQWQPLSLIMVSGQNSFLESSATTSLDPHGHVLCTKKPLKRTQKKNVSNKWNFQLLGVKPADCQVVLSRQDLSQSSLGPLGPSSWGWPGLSKLCRC